MAAKWIGVLSAILAIAAACPARSHPGARDKRGCHVCKTNCAKWGVAKGIRHCHGKDGQIYYPGEDPDPQSLKPPVLVKDTADGQHAHVDKVIDGDTIKVRLLPGGDEKLTVRLMGIDCPESHKNRKCQRDGKQGRKGCDWQVPRGLKAAKRAAKLLKQQTVTLECEGPCKEGRYGRALRYVRLEDGRDFGLVMVEEGLCQDFGWKYPHPRMKQYIEEQALANKKGKGIWKK